MKSHYCLSTNRPLYPKIGVIDKKEEWAGKKEDLNDRISKIPTASSIMPVFVEVYVQPALQGETRVTPPVASKPHRLHPSQRGPNPELQRWSRGISASGLYLSRSRGSRTGLSANSGGRCGCCGCCFGHSAGIVQGFADSPGRDCHICCC